MAMGKLLAQAGLMQDKNVSWLPSYGGEMRGGTCHCMVIISDQPIASPYMEFCDDAILMNVPSVKKFIPRVKEKGLLVINKENLDELTLPLGLRIINRDFTKEALQLGNKQVANIIALGAYISRLDFFSKSILEEALEEIFSAKGTEVLQLNKIALQRGIELGNK